MKIFLAGATGAVGKRLIPQLVEEGHEVAAMTRSRSKAQALRTLGAEPTIADALDRFAVVMQAVTAAEPEVVVHQLTGLAGVTNLRNFDRAFALTNRLAASSLTGAAARRAASSRRLASGG